MAPQRQKVPARAAARLGVGGDDVEGPPRRRTGRGGGRSGGSTELPPRQVIPPRDVEGVALADDDPHHRLRHDAAVRRPLPPVRVYQARVGDALHVQGQGQRHDVPGQAVADRAGLRAAAAKAETPADGDARLPLVLLGEHLRDPGVGLAGDGEGDEGEGDVLHLGPFAASAFSLVVGLGGRRPAATEALGAAAAVAISAAAAAATAGPATAAAAAAASDAGRRIGKSGRGKGSEGDSGRGDSGGDEPVLGRPPPFSLTFASAATLGRKRVGG